MGPNPGVPAVWALEALVPGWCSGIRAGALPVEHRGVDVQLLHGHLNAPVCVAGGRHGARRAAAQVAQVGELVAGNGGQGAADSLPVHDRGRRARSGRGPVWVCPPLRRLPGLLRCARAPAPAPLCRSRSCQALPAAGR